MAIKRPGQALKTTRVWGTIKSTMNIGPYESVTVEIGEEGEVSDPDDRKQAVWELSVNLLSRIEADCREALKGLPIESRGVHQSGRLAIHYGTEKKA